MAEPAPGHFPETKVVATKLMTPIELPPELRCACGSVKSPAARRCWDCRVERDRANSQYERARILKAQGLSAAQIAEALNTTVSNVRKNLLPKAKRMGRHTQTPARMRYR